MSDSFFTSPESSLCVEKYGHWRGAELSSVLPVLQDIAAGTRDAWVWDRNPQCKYLTLEIDTRSGGLVRILDRDGSLISVAELRDQALSAADEVEKSGD